jgi:hypothetical protein
MDERSEARWQRDGEARRKYRALPGFESDVLCGDDVGAGIVGQCVVR